MSKTIPEEIQEDIRFLLSFVPAKKPEEVEDGLSPMFYLTLTYKGDVALAKRVAAICEKYGIDNTQEEEEDYADELE